MDFIDRDSGERYTISHKDQNGWDRAEEIAISFGFTQRTWSPCNCGDWDEKEQAYIVAASTIKHWEAFFEKYAAYDEALNGLKRKYDKDEVEALHGFFFDDYFIENFMEAYRDTLFILKARYDIQHMRRVGSFEANLPADNAEYCKETLYQRNDESFFIVGEGGGMSPYGRRQEDGSLGRGECSYSISDAEANKWITKHGSVAPFGAH